MVAGLLCSVLSVQKANSGKAGQDKRPTLGSVTETVDTYKALLIAVVQLKNWRSVRLFATLIRTTHSKELAQAPKLLFLVKWWRKSQRQSEKGETGC